MNRNSTIQGSQDYQYLYPFSVTSFEGVELYFDQIFEEYKRF